MLSFDWEKVEREEKARRIAQRRAGSRGVEGEKSLEDRKAATRRSARKTQTRKRQAVNLVEKDRQGRLSLLAL